MKTRSTTIIGLIHNKKAAMAGDGQVTFGETVLKTKAVKLRKFHNDTILAGFAGAAADALALYELFEKKIEEYSGNLPKAAVELAKELADEKSPQFINSVLDALDKE